MKTRVLLTANAEAQLAEAVSWYVRHDRSVAARWQAGFGALIRRLPRIAKRASPIPESEHFPVKMQQVEFGLGRTKSHRVVFVVRPEAIVVYAIRHLAQDEFTPRDV